MKARVIERAEILVPNKEHKSFSGSNKFIEKGKEINGEPKVITGKRKGEQFDYRLFELNDNQYIHLNKVKINQKPEQMKATEVTLGADASPNPTIIDTKPTGFSISSHPEIMGAAVGAIVGWAYSHTMKHDNKKKAYYALGVAAAGYGVGAYIKHRRAITITPTKKGLNG